MIHFLNLIRWKNLVIIALVQVLVKYALLLPFFESHGVITALKPLAFTILVVATICIAAGGYVINDVFDIDTDKVNKPERVIINKYITEKNGFNIFIALNIIGVGLGFYLSNSIGKSGYFAIFIIASALLYIYSNGLKQMTLIGNIAVSVVVALCILMVGIFELIPAINQTNTEVQIFFLKIILDYAIFAFMINLVREIVKDIEDIDGDHKSGMKTLPIVIGRERATKVAFGLSLIPLFGVVYYVVTYFFKQQLLLAYFLIAVIAPMIYISIKLFSAEHKKQYNHISTMLKLVMVTGILSMLLYSYVLK
ncbi:MAG: geranylgeranylglycerol-phosphate geranylgeranyltransferase [Winogradskyella sp.]|uniref:geranylgeranylglycerol-phosphate geranylgeranyltransferase n=1 Tax=Winogradskyella sp. TaxID=1883156 RepID=UPI0025E58226|nr:geranylgeranylglycerol-phosphate geranylgeranyltransferase [Winogradskyella sp.]NRB61176.1 geranylgeranylglycerol-phosphate geranylgeranyltransferase [Winogradskyella sp.]